MENGELRIENGEFGERDKAREEKHSKEMQEQSKRSGARQEEDGRGN